MMAINSAERITMLRDLERWFIEPIGWMSRSSSSSWDASSRIACPVASCDARTLSGMSAELFSLPSSSGLLAQLAAPSPSRSFLQFEVQVQPTLQHQSTNHFHNFGNTGRYIEFLSRFFCHVKMCTELDMDLLRGLPVTTTATKRIHGEKF